MRFWNLLSKVSLQAVSKFVLDYFWTPLLIPQVAIDGVLQTLSKILIGGLKSKTKFEYLET